MRERHFFWPEVPTVKRSCQDTTSMAGWRILIISILGDILMGVQNIPTNMVKGLVSKLISGIDNISVSFIHICIWHLLFKLNIVCGGLGGDDIERLDSCEVNTSGTKYWTYTTPLPRAMYNVEGVTLDNRVLMIGKWKKKAMRTISRIYCVLGGGWDGINNRDEILAFEGGVWTEVARMQNRRSMHAVSVINIDEYWMFCKTKISRHSYLSYALWGWW